jgi:hypothetical protein
MTCCYVVTSKGEVYAAAFEGDTIIGASEALSVDDALDEEELPARAYWSDLGAALDVTYRRGAASVIAHRFEIDAH